MSIAAISWVFKQEIKPSSLKFVLVALADCADDKGICWPSVDHITETTCQDRKTVIKSLDDLESKGWLVDTGKRMGRTNQVKVYRLTDAFFSQADTTACAKGTENGSLRKESRSSAERVPFFPAKGPENGIPPTPPYGDDPSIDPSSQPLSGDDGFFKKCFDHITKAFPNLTPQNAAPIHQWQVAGYNFETQVKPTIDSAVAKKAAPRSFKFFTAMLEDAAKPISKAPPKEAPVKRTPIEQASWEAEQHAWYRKIGKQHPQFNPEGLTHREAPA